jgi:hypothetical protein
MMTKISELERGRTMEGLNKSMETLVRLAGSKPTLSCAPPQHKSHDLPMLYADSVIHWKHQYSFYNSVGLKLWYKFLFGHFISLQFNINFTVHCSFMHVTNHWLIKTAFIETECENLILWSLLFFMAATDLWFETAKWPLSATFSQCCFWIFTHNIIAFITKKNVCR